MPRERKYRTKYGYEFDRTYDEGYDDGYRDAMRQVYREATELRPRRSTTRRPGSTRRKPSRRKPVKLSKWQKYIKNKKNHIKLRNGKLNLKKMAVQYRKKNK